MFRADSAARSPVWGVTSALGEPVSSIRAALPSTPMDNAGAALVSWAESGAMALTGPAHGAPSAAPAAVATAAAVAADALRLESARWGRAVAVDGPGLLGERAAIGGLTRGGSTSVGGAARFFAASDGWVVLNLPRPEDAAALPALVSADVAADDWPSIERGLRSLTCEELVDQATLLGLAVAAAHPGTTSRSHSRKLASGGPRIITSTPLVVDLSSLWAGPLAAQLIGAAGARVIKVEGRDRPDGARRGSSAFFDLLNHEKECLQVDFRNRDEIALLQRLIGAADLVIEGSRPRVMDALGIDPAAVAAAGTNWLSITAHGRTGDAAQRVGFGDDAAVAGGLFVPGAPPMFVADAVADPLTGLVAAGRGAALLGQDRAAVIEVALARVSSWASGPSDSTAAASDIDGWYVEVDGERLPVAAPHHRPVPAAAPAPGAQTASIVAEFVDETSRSPG